jgi:hypothetical protein
MSLPLTFILRASKPGFLINEDLKQLHFNLTKECHRRAATAGYSVSSIVPRFYHEFMYNNDPKNEWHPYTVTSKPADYEYDIRTTIQYTATSMQSLDVMVICERKLIDTAKMYAHEVWPEHKGTIHTISSRLDLMRVYNMRLIPCIVLPGTAKTSWDSDVMYHDRCGRIVLIFSKDIERIETPEPLRVTLPEESQDRPRQDDIAELS